MVHVKVVRRTVSSPYREVEEENTCRPRWETINEAVDAYTEQCLSAYPHNCFTAFLDSSKLYQKTMRLFLGINKQKWWLMSYPARGRLTVKGIPAWAAPSDPTISTTTAREQNCPSSGKGPFKSNMWSYQEGQATSPRWDAYFIHNFKMPGNKGKGNWRIFLTYENTCLGVNVKVKNYKEPLKVDFYLFEFLFFMFIGFHIQPLISLRNVHFFH